MIQQVSVLLPAIAVCLAIVQAYPELSGNSASPYSFGYASSESARQESSDASGKVTGSYRVTNEDGSVRVVNYVADDQGFRAEVETDEAGTTDDQPADVVVRSTAASPKRFDGSMVERQMEQVKMRTSPLVLERQQRKMHTPSAVRVERLQGKMWSRAAPQRVAAQVMQQKKYGMTPVESALLAPLMNRYQAAQQAQGKMYSRPAVQQERLQNMMYSRPAVQQERLQAMMYPTPAVQQERLQAMMYPTPAVQQERLQAMMYPTPAVQQERLQAMMYPTPAVQQENSQGNMYAPAAFQQKRNEFLNHYSAHAAAQQGSHAHSFLYNINHGDGGSHYRSESGDGNGNVVGSYTLSGPDGRYRLVKYLADEGGFRAIVKTNEHGTREESPSHAQFVSLV